MYHHITFCSVPATDGRARGQRPTGHFHLFFVVNRLLPRTRSTTKPSCSFAQPVTPRTREEAGVRGHRRRRRGSLSLIPWKTSNDKQKDDKRSLFCYMREIIAVGNFSKYML